MLLLHERCKVNCVCFHRRPPPFYFIEGKILKLNPEAEEVMTFYAKMLDHDYTTKKDFNKNFFGDWRKVRFVCCSYQLLAGKLCTWASEGVSRGGSIRVKCHFSNSVILEKNMLLLKCS